MIRIVIDKFRGVLDMNDNVPEIPLGLQMALAHNVPAMQAFLNLADSQQDELIKKAQRTKTQREIQKLVDDIPRIRLE